MTGRQTIIPFGPQHPVLPEPIHLDLVVEDERVVSAIPSIGYVHRGLESLVDRREYQDFVFLAERICGICSFTHSSTFCQGIEGLMGIQIASPQSSSVARLVCRLARVRKPVLSGMEDP